MPGNVTRASAALPALGALTYTAWVLEVLVRTGLDPVRTYVSELAASDQPFGAFFRATDLVAGALVLAGAVLGWAGTRRSGAEPEAHGAGSGDGSRSRAGSRLRSRSPLRSRSRSPLRFRFREPWALVGWGALALFGAATVADSRLPLSCAATADPACAARETPGSCPPPIRPMPSVPVSP